MDKIGSLFEQDVNIEIYFTCVQIKHFLLLYSIGQMVKSVDIDMYV